MADEEADNLENWEEQADSGMLDKRLEEMALDLQTKEEERKKQATKSNSAPDSMILSEDSGRTQYQPQVRILRREANGPYSSSQKHTNISGATSIQSSKHSKSLQQREVEYAQARLRIFGSLPPDDDDGDDDVETSDEILKVCNNNIQNESPPHIIAPDPSLPHMTVLRQPKGPDGTNGFTKSYPT